MKNKISKLILVTTLISTSIFKMPVLAEDVNPLMQTSNQSLMEPEKTSEETNPTLVKSENVAMKIQPITNTPKTKNQGSHIVRDVATVVVVGAAAVATVYVGAAFLIFAILGGVAI